MKRVKFDSTILPLSRIRLIQTLKGSSPLPLLRQYRNPSVFQSWVGRRVSWRLSPDWVPSALSFIFLLFSSPWIFEYDERQLFERQEQLGHGGGGPNPMGEEYSGSGYRSPERKMRETNKRVSGLLFDVISSLDDFSTLYKTAKQALESGKKVYCLSGRGSGWDNGESINGSRIDLSNLRKIEEEEWSLCFASSRLRRGSSADKSYPQEEEEEMMIS
ncbi:hypothetical protein LINGRAHAP2_LOCUS17843 [Linum grandiflorum]